MAEAPQAPAIRRGAPVHPLSALVTVILDGLWTVVEVPQAISPTILLTSGLLCLICAAAVTFVQRHVAKDDWAGSITKGLVMGVAAGVPYPVVGTAAGVVLLAWAGVDGVRTLLSPRRAG